MPKAQSKSQLLSESQKEHAALEEFLATLTPDQMTQPGLLGEWSAKDVLAHLYEWEQMVLRWLAASQRGENPHVPAEGYKWSQLPALNERIRENYDGCSLDKILILFNGSYQQIMQTIESLPEDTLFTPGLYPWMNKNTLWAYFVSCTSSHYRWARKEMKKGLKPAGHA